MLSVLRQIVHEGKGVYRKRFASMVLHIALWPILLIPRLFWPHRRVDRNSIRRILLMRVDGIGDLTMSAVILATLRRKFPDAQIDLITSVAGKPIGEMYAAGNLLNDVRALPENRTWRDYLRLAKELRGRQYDAAIDLRGDLRSVLLFWLAGIPIRIGMRSSGASYLLSDVASVDHFPRHQAEEVLAMARMLGVEQADPYEHLPLQPAERTTAEQMLRDAGMLSGRPIAAFHMGGSVPSKHWPAERFVAAARHLQRNCQTHVIVVGGPEDLSAAQAFNAQLDEPALLAVGTVNLAVTAALIARCQVFVGNDSGPGHIAACVGCPSVILFGPSTVEIYRPLSPRLKIFRPSESCDSRCGDRCVRGQAACMLEHQADAVAAAAAKILNDDQLAGTCR